MESLEDYLEGLMEKGSDYLADFLERIYKYFNWKRSIVIFVLMILITRLGCQPDTLTKYMQIPNETKHKLITDVKTKYEKEKKSIDLYLKAIAERESSGNPKIVNKLGYMGKYQFGETALKEVGLDKKVKLSKFRRNPSIWPEKQQDIAMKKLLSKNKQYLRIYISKYNNKVVGGIKITESGLLAGAHLLGASNVKKFLDSGGKHNPTDGFGTKLSEYLNKFSGYSLNLST
jgi:hypothetical protein